MTSELSCSRWFGFVVTDCVVLKDSDVLIKVLDLFCVDCSIPLSGRKWDLQADFRIFGR